MAAASVRINPIGIGVVALVSASALLYITGLPSWMSASNEKVTLNEVNMRELLSVSIDLARQAGKKVKAIRQGEEGMNEKVKGETREGAKEILTDGDLQSHRILMNGLKMTYPGLKVVSEEHDSKPLGLENIVLPNKHLPDVSELPDAKKVLVDDIAVWIDPLDATQEYTENLVQYVTVMVCVAVRGAPTIGVIHSPFSGETSWGWVGVGHSPNIAAPDASKANKNGPYKIIVSRSHSGTVEEVAKSAFGESTEVIPAGGAGYKTLQVIKGAADAYAHVTIIKKWDICAGNALLDTLNGRMSTLHDETIDYHAEGSPINEQGLLATIFNHQTFLSPLRPLFDKEKEKRH